MPMTIHSTLLFVYEQYPNSQLISLENPQLLLAKIDAELVNFFGAKRPAATPSDECINKILAFAKESR